MNQCRRADNTDIFAKRGHFDTQLVDVAFIDHALADGSTHRVEQQIAKLAYPAADDDDFRVEQMQQAGQAQANYTPGALDNFEGQRVALLRCLPDDTAVDASQITLHQIADDRRVPTLDALTSLTGNRGASRHLFKTQFLTINYHQHVADMSCETAMTEQQTSINEHAAADARAEGDINGVLAALRRPPRYLSQHSDIGIVADIGRDVEHFAQALRQRHMMPAGQIGRGQHHAGHRIKRARRGHANTGDFCLWRPHGANQVDYAPNDAIRPFVSQSQRFVAQENIQVIIQARSADARPAQINANNHEFYRLVAFSRRAKIIEQINRNLLPNCNAGTAHGESHTLAPAVSGHQSGISRLYSVLPDGRFLRDIRRGRRNRRARTGHHPDQPSDQ